MHLVIFDIDGTLIDSCAFDDALYAEAVEDVLNVQIDCSWWNYRNVTDSGILDELLDARGLSGCRAEIHANVKKKFVNSVRGYIDRHPVREIPGAKGLLEELQRHNAVSVAIATGGWRETALLKLKAIGVDANSIPLATASDSTDRCEILKIAVNRANIGQAPAQTTYFGDADWDKKAASELRYEFIGVGSKVAHCRTVPNLADHAFILRQLGV